MTTWNFNTDPQITSEGKVYLLGLGGQIYGAGWQFQSQKDDWPSAWAERPAHSHGPLLTHLLTVFQAPRAQKAVCQLCWFTSEWGGHQTPGPWAGSAAQRAQDCRTTNLLLLLLVGVLGHCIRQGYPENQNQ